MSVFPAAVRDRLLPIALSQAAGLACGLVGVRLATQWVAPADYGVFGVFLTFTPLGMWVVYVGLLKAVVRLWAASPDRRGLLHEVGRQAWRQSPWLGLATLGAAVALGGGGPWWATWLLLWLAAALLAVVAALQAALQAEQSHWRDLAVSATASGARTMAPLLGYVAWGGGSWLALAAGFEVYAVLAVAVGWWMLRPRLQPRDRGLREAQVPATYTGPLFAVLALAGWATVGLNRWIVGVGFGTEVAGYFTLAGNMAQVVTAMVGVVFLQFFQPGFFAAASEEPGKRRALARRVDRVAAGYWLVAVAGVGLLHVVAPWLVGSLVHERYRAALDWLLATGGFGVAVATGLFYQSLLLAGRREKWIWRVELTMLLCVAIGGTVAAIMGGAPWFARWLMVTPLLPWLVHRPLARRGYFTPAANHGPAAAR